MHEKVACGLAYQALLRRQSCALRNRCCASRVTMECKPNKQGVVRAMALSGHCHSVSMPRWARASSKRTEKPERSKGAVDRDADLPVWQPGLDLLDQLTRSIGQGFAAFT